MDATGLSKPGAYKRLALNRDDETVFLKAGALLGMKQAKSKWVSEPVRVAMGIPINPSYLDGVVKGNSMYNRDGELMKYGARCALVRYNAKLRKEWRDSTPNIKNKERYG
jgi:hypothetical protein